MIPDEWYVEESNVLLIILMKAICMTKNFVYILALLLMFNGQN